MAKLSVTITVTLVFFSLFAFSNARAPLLVSENTVNKEERDSDSNPTLLLPSQKHRNSDTGSGGFVTDHAKSETEFGSESDLSESVAESVESIPLTKPLTIVRFRPVNRHFRVKRSFPLRFSHRNCHHHHHDDREQSNRPFHGGEISYGDDMILSSERTEPEPEPEMFRGGVVRQIPAKWIRFHRDHHHHHQQQQKGVPRFVYRYDHVSDEEEEKKRGVVESKGDGFMKHIRKFLNHF